MFRNSRILVLFCFLAMSCGGGNPAPSGRTSSLIAQAPPSITGLEGYTAGLVREPVFGGEVYVVEAGPEDGLPLVLVHGLGKGGARDWYGLLPGLAEKYRVLAFDLPGFGASTKENELYSPSRYVDFIKWITSERIGGQFDLLGHSMGATLSLLYAGTHPGDIKHLILADAACILDRHVLMSYMAENNLAGPRILKERLGGVVGFMAPIFMEISEDFAPDLRSLIETEASREKWLGGNSARIAALALVLEDVNREIDNITSPTMLIWGREDTVAPLRTGRIVAKRIPGAKLEILEGVGHVPMNDARDKFESLVIQFLESQPTVEPRPNPPKSPFTSGRTHKCRGEVNQFFEGDYDYLELKGCENISIRNARIRTLVVESSTVEVEDSWIGAAEGVGLEMKSAVLRMTGGSIFGSPPLLVNDSSLDLAGVTFHSNGPAVVSEGPSKVIFSVCDVKSADKTEYLHGVYSLKAGKDTGGSSPKR